MLIGINSFTNRGVDRSTRGVGGIFAKPDVTNQVAVRQGREAAVGEARECPLVVPRCNRNCLSMRKLPDGTPIVALHSVIKDRFQQTRLAQGRPLPEVRIVVMPAAAPGGPSPDQRNASKVITTITTPLSILEVVAADAPHPHVVAVAL